MDSLKGLSTTRQIILIYILIGPVLALGLVSTFIGVPDFLEKLNQQLSVAGGIGPILIGASLIVFAGVLTLNMRTDEDAESRALSTA
jgi:H+/Cl- antiporter ClcA